MSRRRNNDTSDLLFELLQDIFGIVPPWLSVPVAGAGYFLITWWWRTKVKVLGVGQLGTVFGALFAAICLGAGLKAWSIRRERERFLKAKIDLDWVKNLSWRRFEHHVAEVYRQKGYGVEELGGGGPDGGIDVRLSKDGKTTLVQCKHWQKWKVGVREIREIFGVMTAERADAVIFIASGRYSLAAQQFARGKPIELIGQNGFVDLVRQFQRELKKEPAAVPPLEDSVEELSSMPPPRCPKCRNLMKLRLSRTGAKAGKQFWGCSTYPKCRGTLDVIVPKQFGR